MAVDLSGLFSQLTKAGSQYNTGIMPTNPNERNAFQAAGVANPMLQLFGRGLAGTVGVDVSSPNQQMRASIEQQASSLPPERQELIKMLAKSDPQRAMLQLEAEKSKEQDRRYATTYDQYTRALANGQPVVASQLAATLSTTYPDRFTQAAQIQAQSTARAAKDEPRAQFIIDAQAEIRNSLGNPAELAKVVADLTKRSQAFGTPININELVTNERRNADIVRKIDSAERDRVFNETIYAQLVAEDPEEARLYKENPDRSTKDAAAFLRGEREEAEAEQRQIEGEERRAALANKGERSGESVVKDKTTFDDAADQVFNNVLGKTSLSESELKRVKAAFNAGISGVYSRAKGKMTVDEVVQMLAAALEKDQRIAETIRDGSDEYDTWGKASDASLSNLISEALKGAGGAPASSGGAVKVGGFTLEPLKE